MNMISDLPVEILTLIMKLLHLEDLIALAQVVQEGRLRATAKQVMMPLIREHLTKFFTPSAYQTIIWMPGELETLLCLIGVGSVTEQVSELLALQLVKRWACHEPGYYQYYQNTTGNCFLWIGPEERRREYMAGLLLAKMGLLTTIPCLTLEGRELSGLSNISILAEMTTLSLRVTGANLHAHCPPNQGIALRSLRVKELSLDHVSIGDAEARALAYLMRKVITQLQLGNGVKGSLKHLLGYDGKGTCQTIRILLSRPTQAVAPRMNEWPNPMDTWVPKWLDWAIGVNWRYNMPQPIDRVTGEAAVGILELSANEDSHGWVSFKITDCPYWNRREEEHNGEEQLNNNGGIFAVSPQFVTRRLCQLPAMDTANVMTHL